VWTPEAGLVEYQAQPVDSYVRQVVELGAAVWGDQGVAGVTDTTGTDRTLRGGGTADPAFEWGASSGQAGFGIQIGSDGTAEDITDNSLGSLLTTDLAYGATAVGTGSVSGSSAFSDTTRTVTNNTGSGVDITEAGLTARHSTINSGNRDFLCLRDTGSPIVSVGDGSNVTLEYELEFRV